jgi:lipoprotein-anchoring transpeptidase ErfK/SrfK
MMIERSTQLLRIARRWLSAFAVTIAIAIGTIPTTASAQDLFSFLWDGGSRSVIGFSSKYEPRQIIVSFGDKKLYWIHRRGEAISYPIAVPREQSRWQGVTSVSSKQVNPSWTPTPTMPGGHPMNPMGVRALYLGSSAYRIHGTDAPWTIGTAVSKGCIRMYNEDVLDLYPRVPVGTKVTVTWQRFS